jgi:hypothetical protein
MENRKLYYSFGPRCNPQLQGLPGPCLACQAHYQAFSWPMPLGTAKHAHGAQSPRTATARAGTVVSSLTTQRRWKPGVFLGSVVMGR